MIQEPTQIIDESPLDLVEEVSFIAAAFEECDRVDELQDALHAILGLSIRARNQLSEVSGKHE